MMTSSGLPPLRLRKYKTLTERVWELEVRGLNKVGIYHKRKYYLLHYGKGMIQPDPYSKVKMFLLLPILFWTNFFRSECYYWLLLQEKTPCPTDTDFGMHLFWRLDEIFLFYFYFFLILGVLFFLNLLKLSIIPFRDILLIFPHKSIRWKARHEREEND